MSQDRLEILLPGRDAPGDRFRAWVGKPEWTPASDLFGAGLDDALTGVRDALGTDSDAVAGSVLLEAYAQRVVPPAIAARALAGRSVDTAPESVRIRLEDGLPREVAFAAWGAARPLDATVLKGLEPVVDALDRRTRAGHRVLSGAIAHAVTVAFLHLSWPDRDHAHHIADARRVLAGAGLDDLVRVEAVEVDADGKHGPWLYADRRTCCLAFRTARNQTRGLSFCATCPVVPEVERRRSFTHAVDVYLRRHSAR